MNDKFSAQVRRHLLENADERPAAGLLAALDAQVATTSQRRPIVARLAGFPARVGPFPMRTLRYGLIAVALVGALLAAALYGGTPRPTTVFEGTWLSIDPGDDSEQSIVVGPGATPAVRFTDHHASGLACVNDSVKVFTADGHGTIEGNQLMVVWPDGGGCGLMTVEVPEGPYRYDRTTDTLVDNQQLIWVREPSVVPPTRGPVVEPTAEPAPTRDPNCIQFDAPGTYTAGAGTMSITVDVPATAAAPWIGDRDGFRMFQAACADPQGTGFTQAVQATRVFTDGCAGTNVVIETTADAIAAVSEATTVKVVERAEVTVGGYSSTRFDLTVPPLSNGCPEGQVAVVDGMNPLEAGLNVTLYLIDVDGRTLALALYTNTDWDPSVTAAVDSMIASMQITVAPTPTIASPTEPARTLMPATSAPETLTPSS